MSNVTQQGGAYKDEIWTQGGLASALVSSAAITKHHACVAQTTEMHFFVTVLKVRSPMW